MIQKTERRNPPHPSTGAQMEQKGKGRVNSFSLFLGWNILLFLFSDIRAPRFQAFRLRLNYTTDFPVRQFADSRLLDFLTSISLRVNPYNTSLISLQREKIFIKSKNQIDLCVCVKCEEATEVKKYSILVCDKILILFS